MANKTLSIKMDEKDIEKLKRYHKALIKAGITSEQDMSFNALCKHLLLDYISEDVKDAASACNSLGFRIPDESVTWSNIYHLSGESFSILQKCYEEDNAKWEKELEEAIHEFEELGNVEFFRDGDGHASFMLLPDDCQEVPYWVDRWLDRRSRAEDGFSKKELDGIIEFIEKSSVSDNEKKKLIEEMREKHEQRRLAFMRTQRIGKL